MDLSLGRLTKNQEQARSQGDHSEHPRMTISKEQLPLSPVPSLSRIDAAKATRGATRVRRDEDTEGAEGTKPSTCGHFRTAKV